MSYKLITFGLRTRTRRYVRSVRVKYDSTVIRTLNGFIVHGLLANLKLYLKNYNMVVKGGGALLAHRSMHF